MGAKYGIGLDIGTASIGWSVVDEQGRPRDVKGQRGLGVYLFKEGEAAAERRGFRAVRRRISRRRWRLRLLREIFDEHVSQIDENFFARLKASNVAKGDERHHQKFRLFNNRRDADFYQDYPTMYHLRWALMTDDRQHDIREIYLALHHMVKYRGNFLRNGNPATFKPGNINLGNDFSEINELWEGLFGEASLQLPTSDLDILKAMLIANQGTRSDKQKQVKNYLAKRVATGKEEVSLVGELAKAMVGLKTNVAMLVGVKVDKSDQSRWKFSLSDIEDHQDILDELPESAQQIIDVLVNLQASVQLTEIIPNNQDFSQSMVQRYDDHRKHLSWLRDYASEQTDEKRKTGILATYDHYIDGIMKSSGSKKAVSTSDFYKELEKFLKDDITKSTLAAKIEKAIDEEKFMPKQRTKENGVIPYQIHQREMDLIIKKQGKYYKWLTTPNPVSEHRATQPYMLDELISFRVPYYTGPLITPEEQAKTVLGGKFAWMVRKAPGIITPWNFDEKVDRDASANQFIQRMKTTDTYLIGEDVLPQNSLIYQRYMVLNELNNIRVNDKPLERKQKQAIYTHLFKKNNTVSTKKLQDFLLNRGKYQHTPKITGLADPKKFNSGLTTMRKLQEILGMTIDDSVWNEDLEKIINWSTVFEDKQIFSRKLREITWLTEHQRQQIVNRPRYRGWGRLSRKLLMNVQDNQGKSILNQLWDTDLNFMQIYSQDNYTQKIDGINAAGLQQESVETIINNIYTSPQNKKAIRKVVKVVKDIQKAMHGVAPSWIFLEAARGAERNPHRTIQRQKQLEKLYREQAQGIVNSDVAQELKDKIKSKAEFTNRLMLYFLQNGRDIYMNENDPRSVLDIDRLSEYDIDHILPRSLIRDNSLNNLVLVHQKPNREEKGTQFISELLPKQIETWKKMHRQGLVSNEKLNHLLMRSSDIDKYARGFINRQLVETRQIIKSVTSVLSREYDNCGTKLVSVKASLSSQLRRELNLPKLRGVNDYHHAVDAYLAARLGMYLLKAYPRLERFFVYEKYQISRIDLRRFNFIRDMVVPKKGSTGPVKIIDQKTGEVLWSLVDEKRELEKLLTVKKMLVTHEVTTDHGALYGQTIYGARFDAANPGKTMDLIPISRERLTNLYGGHSNQRSAYLALVAFDLKNTHQYKVMAVPINMLQELSAKDDDEKEHYLLDWFVGQQKLRMRRNMKNLKMVLPHVFLGQRVNDYRYGQWHSFGLGTDEMVRNYQQLVLSLRAQRVLVVNKRHEPKNSELVQVYDEVSHQVKRYFPLYKKNLFIDKILDGRDKFLALPLDDQWDEPHKKVVLRGKISVMNDLLLGLHANASVKKIPELGITTPLGFLQDTGGIILTKDATITFESPTGLFRREVALRNLE